MIKVIVIAGATAVGKTDLSIKLAKEYNGEIVNADASQFRRFLDIGTAKIKKDEMDNIKHHLIDIIDPNDDFSIYDYQVKAREIIKDIFLNNKIPFIVGGSGLYIDALINDYDLSKEKNDHNVEEFEKYSNEELYNILLSLDNTLALSTHPNNRKRVIRYIQRARNNDSIDSSRFKPYYDYLFLFFNRDREFLYNRINERTNIMLKNGWIDEVKALKENNIDVSSIKEIGYKEINDYLNNQINYEELIDLIQKNTRHYAKRQITWFKNKSNSVSIDLDKTNIKDIEEMINNFLNS